MADSLRRLMPPGEFRVPIGEPVQLEYPQLKEFGTELAVDLWREGLYVAASRPKPPGTEVDFTLRLGRRLTQISGRGEVAWVRPRGEGPERPAGMEIRFLDLDSTAREVIKLWIAEHGEEAEAEKVEVDERGNDGTAAETAAEEELQAGVAVLRALFGDEGERSQRPSTEVQLSRAKAALLEARQRSEALIGDLRGQLEETRAQLDATNSRLEELEGSSAEQAQRLEEAVTARDQAGRRVGELESERAELASALEETGAKLVGLEKDLGTAREDQRLQAQHLAAERLRQQAVKTEASLQGRLESLQASAAAAEGARVKLARRLEEAAAQRAKQGGQLDRLRSEVSRLVGELETAQAGHEARGKRIEALEGELAKGEAAARADADRLRRTTEARDALERRQATLQSTVDRIQGELEVGREEGRRVQEAARETEAALRARVEALEASLGKAEEARDELTGRLEEGIAVRAALEHKAAESTTERERLGSLVETARAEIRRLETVVAEATRRESEQGRLIEQLERSLKNAESAAAETSQQLGEITRDRDVLKEESAAMTLARDELQQRLTSVQERLSHSRQERLGAELALEQGLVGLQDELTQAQEERQYLTRRLEEMRDARKVDHQRMLDAVSRRSELEKGLADSRAKAASLEKVLSATRESDKKKSARLEEMAASLAAAEKTSLEVAERLEEMTSSQNALRDDQASLEAAHDRLQKELNRVSEERDAIQGRAEQTETALRQEVERLLGELDSKTEAEADLHRHLEQERQASSDAEEDARQSAARVAALEAKLESAGAQEAQLETALATARQDLDDRNRRLVELKKEQAAERAEAGRHRQQAEATQGSLQKNLEKLQAELRAAAEVRDDLSRQLDEGAKSRADLEKERFSLRSALEEKRLKLQTVQEAHEQLRSRAEQTETALRRDLEALVLERAAANKTGETPRQRDDGTTHRAAKPQGGRREADRPAGTALKAERATAAGSQRSRPRTATWLVVGAALAALAVAWLFTMRKTDEPAGSPVFEPGEYRPPAGAVDLVESAAQPTQPPESRGVPDSSQERVVETLRAWALAWSEQRVDDYLDFYSPEFRSTGSRSLAAWSALRRQRILAPMSIEVTLEGIEVELLGPDRATARFVQSYDSQSFSDRVVKLVELHRDEDRWRIVAEEVAP
jgi:chromosome segregation ATPase